MSPAWCSFVASSYTASQGNRLQVKWGHRDYGKLFTSGYEMYEIFGVHL